MEHSDRILGSGRKILEVPLHRAKDQFHSFDSQERILLDVSATLHLCTRIRREVAPSARENDPVGSFWSGFPDQLTDHDQMTVC